MRKIDFLSCFMIVVLWGSSFTMAKFGVVEISPFMLAGLRFFIASLILLPFAGFPKKHLKYLFIIASAVGAQISCFYTGAKYVDAGLLVIALQAGVPISAVLAVIIYKDKVDLKMILGLIISFVGIVYLSGSPRIENISAISIILLGSVFWSIANIVTKKIDDLKPVTLNGYISFFAGVIFITISVLTEENSVSNLFKASYSAWASVFMLAILISVYSDTLWYGLLCRYKVSQVVPFTLLAPVAGVIAGMYFLDEPLNSHKVYGGILVLSGVILIEIKKLPFNNKGKLVKKD